MTPGVQVPVAAIVEHSLRRSDPIAFRAARSRVVAHPQLFAAQCRIADRLKTLRVNRTLGSYTDYDPLQEALWPTAGFAQQPTKFFLERPQLFLNEVRLQLIEQGMHEQQRVDLTFREPQAG